jgi:succinate dehydrogenase (ubiquinone) membrane anchor subunit
MEHITGHSRGTIESCELEVEKRSLIVARTVAIALVPLTVAPFMGSSLNPILDSIFCALLVAHSHVGFQSCIIDYFPKRRVPKTRVALEWTLRIATLATLVGLYEFETNDVGLTEGIKRVWKA